VARGIEDALTEKWRPTRLKCWVRTGGVLSHMPDIMGCITSLRYRRERRISTCKSWH